LQSISAELLLLSSYYSKKYSPFSSIFIFSSKQLDSLIFEFPSLKPLAQLSKTILYHQASLLFLLTVTDKFIPSVLFPPIFPLLLGSGENFSSFQETKIEVKAEPKKDDIKATIPIAMNSDNNFTGHEGNQQMEDT